jgi:excisionase family DNA binding protein
MNLQDTLSTTGRLLRVPEVMAELGIGLTKTYELIGQGSLHAVKLGRRTLVPEASVAAFKSALPKARITTGRGNVA